MEFASKADYAGHYDASGIPMLDYRGHIGLQYNPIAIAQYGLGNYNFFVQDKSEERRRNFWLPADWLVANLAQNAHGIWVWNHHFDWEYRDTLKAPWYSGLAQGQGISLLVRAHHATSDPKYGCGRGFRELDAPRGRRWRPFLRMSVAMSGSKSTWSILPRTS